MPTTKFTSDAPSPKTVNVDDILTALRFAEKAYLDSRRSLLPKSVETPAEGGSRDKDHTLRNM